MNESIPAASLEGVAAYIGIDWADQKHDVVLRSAAEPNKVEHRVIKHQPGALMEWIGQLQQRFGGHGQILVCLELNGFPIKITRMERNDQYRSRRAHHRFNEARPRAERGEVMFQSRAA